MSFRPISIQVVRRLNKIATAGCLSVDDDGNAPETPVDWKRYESQYPALKKLRGIVTEKLSKLGVYMFVVGNRSGWGDAPGEEVGNAFDNDGAWLDMPVVVGNLKIDHETNEVEDPVVLCSLHMGIGDQPALKKVFLKVMQEELGDLFLWDETSASSMLIKLDPEFDASTRGFNPKVKSKVTKSVSSKKKMNKSSKKKKKKQTPTSSPELDSQIVLRKADNKIYNPNTGNWISARSSLAYQLFERMINYEKGIM